MIGVLRVKPGVSFAVIAPGGFCILSAAEISASQMGLDVWITSACDGEHSGPNDPHRRGEAYDFRTHDFTEENKKQFLGCLIDLLGEEHFYCFLESPGTPNEHIHAQVKKGTVYPPITPEGAD